ncbi:hypothetical protein [Ideonella sp. YS5]|uniref:hypothetical protein n=1 Tax=Ideonella sp. YS5 TaxID=3453714 RepID=UPI003EE9DF4E
MNRSARLVSRSTAAMLVLAAFSLPALAASSAASSASDSLSTSVGSVSNSFRGSSESSDRPARTADGDYRVTEVAAADDVQPGMLKLTLAPAAGEGEAFALVLPQKAVDAGGVAVGEVVRAQNRPYGVEFANAGTRQPFFLVLQDDWYRELASNPVTL